MLEAETILLALRNVFLDVDSDFEASPNVDELDPVVDEQRVTLTGSHSQSLTYLT